MIKNIYVLRINHYIVIMFLVKTRRNKFTWREMFR